MTTPLQTIDASLQAVYDQFAETYDKNRGAFDMTQLLDTFYDSIHLKHGHVLDLGCGAGKPVAQFFVERGWSVTGVDISTKMLDLAKKNVPEMTTLHASMAEVDFESSSFNAIVSIYSLFHVPHEQHSALFEKFYQWLQPGGRVLFTYATEARTGCQEFQGYKDFMGEKLFYSHKKPEALYKDIGHAGWVIDSADYHEIGEQTYLWVTLSKPQD